MHPKLRRRWIVKRIIAATVWSSVIGLGWYAIVFVVIIALKVRGSSFSPPSPIDGLLLHGPAWVGIVGACVACAFGILPGSRRPKPGSHCRSCGYELRDHLPGDGIGIRCPECGYYNRFREPAPGDPGLTTPDGS